MPEPPAPEAPMGIEETLVFGVWLLPMLLGTEDPVLVLVCDGAFVAAYSVDDTGLVSAGGYDRDCAEY